MDAAIKKRLKKIKLSLAKITPFPWRWGDWTTNFGEYESVNLRDRRTLEHAPTFLQFSAGIRDRDEPAELIFTIEDPIENEDNAIFIACAPDNIKWLIDLIEDLETQLEKLAK